MRTPDHHSTRTQQYSFESSASYNRRVRLVSGLVTLAGLVLAGVAIYFMFN